MKKSLSHEEFCQKLVNNEIICGVKNFWLSIIYIFGIRSAVVHFLFIILLTVSIAPILIYVELESNWYLILLIPVVAACLTGNEGLSGVNLVFGFVIFFISTLLGFILGLAFYKVGLIPLICFIIASAIKGMTLHEVEHRLMVSAEIYQLLEDKKQLFIYENYEKGTNF